MQVIIFTVKPSPCECWAGQPTLRIFFLFVFCNFSFSFSTTSVFTIRDRIFLIIKRRFNEAGESINFISYGGINAQPLMYYGQAVVIKLQFITIIITQYTGKLYLGAQNWLFSAKNGKNLSYPHFWGYMTPKLLLN